MSHVGRKKFPNAKVVTLRVDKGQWKELGVIAQKHMTSKAALVRRAIGYMIDAENAEEAEE